MKRIIFIYFSIFILFSVSYLASFHTPLFNFQKVLFYRGIALLLFDIIVFFILSIIYFIKYSRKNIESVIAAIIVSAVVHLSIFVVFPVTFERSITMYLLNTLAQSQKNQICQGLTKSQLQDKLIQEYVIKNKAVDKRINEQKMINIINNNQCVRLTTKGLEFLLLSKLVGKAYGLK